MSAHALQYDKPEEGKETDVLKDVTYREFKKPTLTKDTEVLVRIRAAPINPSDLNFIKGKYPRDHPTWPSVPGFEGAGEVEEVGSAVTHIKPKQRVHAVGVGTWGDYVVIDTKTSAVVPLLDAVNYEQGCQLTVNPLTALAMLEELGVKQGDYLLQTGAGSALGRIVIQLGKLRGFKTINVVRRDEQIEELTKLGGDHVINFTKTDIVEKVKEITKGEGVKYAIDCVAGDVGTQVLKSLGVRGTVLLYGRLADEPTTIDVGLAIFKGHTVRGFWLMRWFQENSQQKIQALYAEALGLIVKKQLDLPYKTFDAKTEFHEAVKHARSESASSAGGKSHKTVLLFP